MLPEDWSTARLALRPPRMEDAEAIFAAWATDAEVTRYLTWRPHKSLDDTRAFLERCLEMWRDSTRRVWVISWRGNSSPIGMIEVRPSDDAAEIGYVLARPVWRQGVTTEAVRGLIELTLRELPNVMRITAVCDVDNGASARVLEKSGLVLQGRKAGGLVHPNVSDEPRDVYAYALTRPAKRA